MVAQEGPEQGVPTPHRCNDRVEDVVQALFTLEFSAKIKPAWSTFMKCMRSEVGQEPTDPYQVIEDGKPFLEPGTKKQRSLK
ncbi:hypothetical protein WJX73_005254 [Symbiochloris irregularis]|uniref:Uncharacterized protein n=1 Tax=Symbiochloris irregularis TaxID=706552 RepID=A0AAW1P0A6_9CHLO